SGTGRSEWAFDGEPVDGRVTSNVETIDGGAHEWLDQIVALRLAAQNGGGGNRVDSRFDGNSNCQTPVQFRAKRSGVFCHRGKIDRTANRDELEADTIQRDFDLMGVLHP